MDTKLIKYEVVVDVAMKGNDYDTRYEVAVTTPSIEKAITALKDYNKRTWNKPFVIQKISKVDFVVGCREGEVISCREIQDDNISCNI